MFPDGPSIPSLDFLPRKLKDAKNRENVEIVFWRNSIENSLISLKLYDNNVQTPGADMLVVPSTTDFLVLYKLLNDYDDIIG